MADEHGQPLRAINTRSELLSAVRIADLGLGKTELTRRLPSGSIATDTVSRSFVLADGSVVSDASELGGIDLLARMELECLHRAGAIPADVTSAELDSMSLVSALNYRHCCFPFCPIAGASRSIALADDGNWYCPLHHAEVTDTIKMRELESHFGFVTARLYRFLRSLFCLPRK